MLSRIVWIFAEARKIYPRRLAVRTHSRGQCITYYMDMDPQDNPLPVRIDWHFYDDDSGIIQPHEALDEYEPGGLHTITLGDTFQDGQYHIHDKLGYGGYSTVWLARDLHEKCVRCLLCQKVHSMLIPQQPVGVYQDQKGTHASTDELQNDPEINVMRALEEYYVCGPQDRPRSFVRLLDWFHHEGPNGIHNCLVTELLGPSISGIMRVNKSAGGFFCTGNDTSSIAATARRHQLCLPSRICPRRYEYPSLPSQ